MTTIYSSTRKLQFDLNYGYLANNIVASPKMWSLLRRHNQNQQFGLRYRSGSF